jgi:hypothetical protein
LEGVAPLFLILKKISILQQVLAGIENYSISTTEKLELVAEKTTP